MPAQFERRGGAALEAAQEQGRQILQQSQIQNANKRQAQEIAAQRQMAAEENALRQNMADQQNAMAQQRLFADLYQQDKDVQNRVAMQEQDMLFRQRMAGEEMAFRRASMEAEIKARRDQEVQSHGFRMDEIGQTAKNWGERDAKLDDYAKARIQQDRDWKTYDKTIEDTGMPPEEIEARRIQMGLPFQVAYQSFAQDKQRKDQQKLLDAKLQEAMTVEAAKLSFEDKLKQKRVKDLADSVEQAKRDGIWTPEQLKAYEQDVRDEQYKVMNGFGGPRKTTPQYFEDPDGNKLGIVMPNGRVERWTTGRQPNEPQVEVMPTFAELNEMVFDMRRRDPRYDKIDMTKDAGKNEAGEKVYKRSPNEDLIRNTPISSVDRNAVLDEWRRNQDKEKRLRELVAETGSQVAANIQYEREQTENAVKLQAQIAAEEAEKERRSKVVDIVEKSNGIANPNRVATPADLASKSSASQPAPSSQPSADDDKARRVAETRAKLQAALNRQDLTEEQRLRIKATLNNLE